MRPSRPDTPSVRARRTRGLSRGVCAASACAEDSPFPAQRGGMHGLSPSRIAAIGYCGSPDETRRCAVCAHATVRQARRNAGGAGGFSAKAAAVIVHCRPNRNARVGEYGVCNAFAPRLKPRVSRTDPLDELLGGLPRDILDGLSSSNPAENGGAS